MYEYAAQFEPADEGGFVITFPDIPEIVTQAETPAEGVEMALDALQLALSGYIKRREAIPAPRIHYGGHIVHIALPVVVDAKVALYELMRSKDRKKADLAKALNRQPSEIDRLLNLRHRSRMDDIESAFRILGATLSININDKTLTAGRRG
jgi:antitoxin HicB